MEIAKLVKLIKTYQKPIKYNMEDLTSMCMKNIYNIIIFFAEKMDKRNNET